MLKIQQTIAKTKSFYKYFNNDEKKPNVKPIQNNWNINFAKLIPAVE